MGDTTLSGKALKICVNLRNLRIKPRNSGSFARVTCFKQAVIAIKMLSPVVKRSHSGILR